MLMQISVAAAFLVNLNAGDVRPLSAFSVLKAPETQVAFAKNFVQGRVITAHGAPMANAIVSLLLEENGTVLFTTRTGPDGTYKMRAPESGSYLIRAISIGYTPVTLWAQPDSNGMVQLEITMHEFAHRVQLLMESGAPK